MAIVTIFFTSLSLLNLIMADVNFDMQNKCPFTIWPGVASNNGHQVIAGGGFAIPSGASINIQAPADWIGRIWGRTGCDFSSGRVPSCDTGDCGEAMQCNGKSGAPPATLVEIVLQPQKNVFDVSIVDGYNIPVRVVSKDMPNCLIDGCSKDLNAQCPTILRAINGNNAVVACKSACLAFHTDAYCCTGAYNTPEKCKASEYSAIFKDSCPHYQSKGFESLPLTCASTNYAITFCP